MSTSSVPVRITAETIRTPSGHEGIRYRVMSSAEMKRYDALNSRWAARKKLTRSQFDYLMDNLRRYEISLPQVPL